MGELLTFPADNFSVPTSPSFFELCAERRSMRGYLPTPVAPEVLERLLVCARRAPSGANLQPGSFTWVKGEVREAMSADLVRAWRDGEAEVGEEAHRPRIQLVAADAEVRVVGLTVLRERRDAATRAGGRALRSAWSIGATPSYPRGGRGIMTASTSAMVARFFARNVARRNITGLLRGRARRGILLNGRLSTPSSQRYGVR